MMFLKKLKLNSASGYTLVELLAVIAIITIMSAAAVTSYSSTKKSAALDKAVRQLALDLRRVQNMAMNTAVFVSSVPAGGYGMHLTASAGTYIIFADTFSTLAPPLTDKTYSAGSDGIVASFSLDSPIVIESTGANDIVFLPPNPLVFFNGSVPVGNIDIVIRYGSAGGPTKKITINGLTGQISVN